MIILTGASGGIGKAILPLLSKIDDVIAISYSKNLDVRNLEINQTPFEVGEIFNKKNLKTKEDFFLYPRLDIGFGEKDYGIKTGGKGIHIDNPQRLISILFYAGGYSNIEGGEHRLWRVNDEKIEIVIWGV